MSDDDATATAEVNVQGHVFQITATPIPGAAEWRARLSGWTYRPGTPEFQRRATQGEGLFSRDGVMPPMEETGPSAAAAIAALAPRVRAAAEGALRVYPRESR